jgi:hypothetical protein
VGSLKARERSAVGATFVGPEKSNHKDAGAPSAPFPKFGPDLEKSGGLFVIPANGHDLSVTTDHENPGRRRASLKAISSTGTFR